MSSPGDGLRPPAPDPVAVLGLDPHGAALAAGLVRAGRDVTVWAHPDDDPAVLAPLVRLGAVQALGAAGAADGRRVVVLRLPDAAAVHAVLDGDGDEPGVVDVLSRDAVVVDTSALLPREVASVARALDRRDRVHLEASLSGSARRAAEGRLDTYVGGDPGTLDSVRDVLGTWTAPGRLTWAGGPGAGAAARVVAVSASAVALQTVGEMLRLGRDLGLHRDVVTEVLTTGPLGGLVGAKQRRLAEHDAGGAVAEVAEPLAEVADDLAVALRYAGAALPALEGAYLHARLAVAAGAGGDDVVALALAREGTAHLDDPDLRPGGAGVSP